MTTANEIESLRAFAVAHGELPFAHLCTAALAGEDWAVERIADVYRRVAERDLASCPTSRYLELEITIAVIRSTDTTRPDGAIARKMAAPI